MVGLKVAMLEDERASQRAAYLVEYLAVSKAECLVWMKVALMALK